MLKKLTNLNIKVSEESDENNMIELKDTVRGKKYDFVKKKMMNKCNSTDMEDIIPFVKTTENVNYKNAWETIYRLTENLQTIKTETYIETKLTLIWEQIREKKKCFLINSDNYWNIDIIKDI